MTIIKKRNWISIYFSFVAVVAIVFAELGHAEVEKPLLSELPDDLRSVFLSSLDTDSLRNLVYVNKNTNVLATEQLNKKVVGKYHIKCMIEKDQVWGSDSVDQTLLSPDGSKILTRSSSSIQIWDAESCQLISIWEVQNSAAIFSPDGEKILVSESHSKGFSWNLRNVTTGKLLRSGRTENRAKFLSFSPDGKEFIEIDDGVISNNMRIRSIEEKGEASLTVTFSRLHELDFFYGLNTAYYSPSGRSVITADRNGWVRLLNPKKGFWSWHSYIKPPSRMYPFTSASLSPDATQVLLTGEYGRVLDRISGKILYEFKHPGWLSRITSASFSPDGNRLISSSNDNTARIWNAETRAHLHTLEGHTDTVHSASFFPDSHRIVTGSKDQPVIVWDPKIRNILEM